MFTTFNPTNLTDISDIVYDDTLGEVRPTVVEADLSLTKAVDNANPNEGDPMTFTFNLSNAGPNPATGVQVTDLLPAGATLASATPSQETYDSVTGSGTWEPSTPAASPPRASARLLLALAAGTVGGYAVATR
ncbi:MAG TPA: DUF11 domain-containing protein [Dehalococcoidia bacterium]|nr:DUF11 domain-containing protein [Dehalococcoidia bacterium]